MTKNHQYMGPALMYTKSVTRRIVREELMMVTRGSQLQSMKSPLVIFC